MAFGAFSLRSLYPLVRLSVRLRINKVILKSSSITLTTRFREPGRRATAGAIDDLPARLDPEADWPDRRLFGCAEGLLLRQSGAAAAAENCCREALVHHVLLSSVGLITLYPGID
jgi:hypothetical protein